MAIRSDGTNYLVHTPGSWSLPASSGNMSIGIWHYPRANVVTTLRTAPVTFSEAAGTERLGGFFWDFEDPYGQYRYAWYLEETAASPSYQYSSQPTINQWNLYGMTLQGSLTTNNVTINLNGVDDTPVSNDCGTRFNTISKINLFHDAFGASICVDSIAEVFVYDRILAEADWATLYANGPPGLQPIAVYPSDLQVWWPGVDLATVETQIQSTGGSFTDTGAGAFSTAPEAHPVEAIATPTNLHRQQDADLQGNFYINFEHNIRFGTNADLVDQNRVRHHNNAYLNSTGTFPPTTVVGLDEFWDVGPVPSEAFSSTATDGNHIGTMGNFTYVINELLNGHANETKTCVGVVPTDATNANFKTAVPGLGSTNEIGSVDYCGADVWAPTWTDSVLAGEFNFAQAGYTVNEDAGSIAITVTRTGGSDGAVSVGYATSDGTAVAGSDYTTTAGTLNWSDGDDVVKTFSVPILSGGGVESTETLNLSLSSPTGGASLGGQNSALLTILDADEPLTEHSQWTLPTEQTWKPIIPGCYIHGSNQVAGSGRPTSNTAPGTKVRTKVYFVTDSTVNDTAGGFTYGFLGMGDASGSRTVIPLISALVDYPDTVGGFNIKNTKQDKLTYFGAAAPGYGFHVANVQFSLGWSDQTTSISDFLIWHLSILGNNRDHGASGKGSPDNLSIFAATYPVSNALIANCTLSYAQDEAIEVYKSASNIGIWQTHIFYPIYIDWYNEYDFPAYPGGSFAFISDDSSDISYVRNLHNGCDNRNPLIANTANMYVANNISHGAGEGNSIYRSSSLVKTNIEYDLHVDHDSDNSFGLYRIGNESLPSDGWSNDSDCFMQELKTYGGIDSPASKYTSPSDLIRIEVPGGVEPVATRVSGVDPIGFNVHPLSIGVETVTQQEAQDYYALHSGSVGCKPNNRHPLFQKGIDWCENAILGTGEQGPFKIGTTYNPPSENFWDDGLITALNNGDAGFTTTWCQDSLYTGGTVYPGNLASAVQYPITDPFDPSDLGVITQWGGHAMPEGTVITTYSWGAEREYEVLSTGYTELEHWMFNVAKLAGGLDNWVDQNVQLGTTWIGVGLTNEHGAVATNDNHASVIYDYRSSVGGTPLYAPGGVNSSQAAVSPRKPQGDEAALAQITSSQVNPYSATEFLIVDNNYSNFSAVCNSGLYNTIYIKKGVDLSGLSTVTITQTSAGPGGQGVYITYWDPLVPNAVYDIKPWNLNSADEVRLPILRLPGAKNITFIGLSVDGGWALYSTSSYWLGDFTPEDYIIINGSAKNLTFWRCYTHHTKSVNVIAIGDYNAGNWNDNPNECTFYECVLCYHQGVGSWYDFDSASSGDLRNNSVAIQMYGCYKTHVVSCEFFNLRIPFQWGDSQGNDGIKYYENSLCAFEDNDVYDKDDWRINSSGTPTLTGDYTYGETRISTKGCGTNLRGEGNFVIGNRLMDFYESLNYEDASQAIGTSLGAVHVDILVESNIIDNFNRDEVFSFVYFNNANYPGALYTQSNNQSIRKNLVYNHGSPPSDRLGHTIYVSDPNSEVYNNTVISTGASWASKLYHDGDVLQRGDWMGNYFKGYANGTELSQAVGPEVDFHYNYYSNAGGTDPAFLFNQGVGADQVATDASLNMGDLTYRCKKLTIDNPTVANGGYRVCSDVVPTTSTPSGFRTGVPNTIGSYIDVGIDNLPIVPIDPVVNATADGDTVIMTSGTAAECGVEFRTTGTEYENTAGNTWDDYIGNWLTAGYSTDVWVSYTVTGGSLTNFVGKTQGTRYHLASTQRFYITAQNTTTSITVNFTFWDAATGGNILDQTANATWQAQHEYTPPGTGTIKWLGDGWAGEYGAIATNDDVTLPQGYVYRYKDSCLNGIPHYAPGGDRNQHPIALQNAATPRKPTGSPSAPGSSQDNSANGHAEEYLCVDRAGFDASINNTAYDTIFIAKGTDLSGNGYQSVTITTTHTSQKQIVWWDPDNVNAVDDVRPWDQTTDKVFMPQINFGTNAQNYTFIGLEWDGREFWHVDHTRDEQRAVRFTGTNVYNIQFVRCHLHHTLGWNVVEFSPNGYYINIMFFENYFHDHMLNGRVGPTYVYTQQPGGWWQPSYDPSNPTGKTGQYCDGSTGDLVITNSANWYFSGVVPGQSDTPLNWVYTEDGNFINAANTNHLYVVSNEYHDGRGHMLQWVGGDNHNSWYEDNDSYQTSTMKCDFGGTLNASGVYSGSESTISLKTYGGDESKMCGLIGNRFFDHNKPWKSPDADVIVGNSVTPEIKTYGLIEKNVFDTCRNGSIINLSYDDSFGGPNSDALHHHSVRFNLLYNCLGPAQFGVLTHGSDNQEVYLNTLHRPEGGNDYSYSYTSRYGTFNTPGPDITNGEWQGNFIIGFARGWRHSAIYLDPACWSYNNCYLHSSGSFPYILEGGTQPTYYTSGPGVPILEDEVFSSLSLGDFEYVVKELTNGDTSETRTCSNVVPLTSTGFAGKVRPTAHPAGYGVGSYVNCGADINWQITYST